MNRSVIARLVVLICLGAVLSIQLRGAALGTASSPSPEIYVICDEDESGTNPVGERFELCSPFPWCSNCLIGEAEARFEQRIDNLYNCQTCLGTGCTQAITQEGFDDEDCQINLVMEDCDPNHPGLEYSYYVNCSNFYYDWTFACSACVE